MTTNENITVLFTDLVGSTELASSLTPEAGDEVRRDHFAALRRAIAASGGTEVKNLGDGLMVVFPIASAALSCAVAMQQAVERDNAGAQRPLGLRIGLSGGEVARDADDYFGDPVIEAARLCTKAEGGQILAADAVRVIAGRRTPHSFSSLGELELKGLPEPIKTLEVGWEPLGEVGAAANTVPLPGRLEITPTTGVVAREGEAEILNDALKRVAAGEGREVILISGEAGLGKTTLVAEAARRGFSSGACVLLGRCQEDLGTSYSPFAEALHHYVAHAPDEALAAHVDAHGGELARMVPALRQRQGELPAPQSTDPDTERYLLYGAIIGLLTDASATQPLVLVLDDLQWADKPSLQLLRHIVANVESARLMILATFRDAELSGAHPLTDVLAALRREPRVRFVELQGFDDTGVLAFMEAAAGQRLEGDGVELAHALYRETDGNPFFVGEVLLNLIETGAIYRDDSGRWVAAGDLSDMALPSSVRQVISARVARLGDRASHILSIAAVIGRDFDLDVLGQIGECEEGELLDLLDGASAANLVREVAEAPDRWSFSHALIQHTLYQDLGASRRSRLHRQVAEAIEAVVGRHPNPRVGELAHHWFSATQPVNTAKAIDYARQAGEAALAALAPDDAVRYFSQALQLVVLNPDSDALMTCDLLLDLGEAQREAGIAAFRETFLDAAQRARELGASARLATAALRNNRGWFSDTRGIDNEKVAVIEAALAATPESDSPERALLLATLGSELALGTTVERRTALADDAVNMARRLGDPATIIRALNLVGDAVDLPSNVGQRLADRTEVLALAGTLGDPVLHYWAATYCRMTAVQIGDFELGTRCSDIARTLSERLRQPMFQWNSTFMEAADAIMRGDSERAEQLATTALELGTNCGQPDAVNFYGGQLLAIRRQQGRLGELIPLVEEFMADIQDMPLLRTSLAQAHLQAGNIESACQMLELDAAQAFDSMSFDVLWLMGVANYAQVASELEAVGPATKLFELLAPYHAQVISIGPTGANPVAFYLGELASVLDLYDQADSYFAAATELNTRGGMKFAEAETQLAWGKMLAVRGGHGEIDRARLLLERACDTATTQGYARVERQATAALASLV